MLQFEEPVRVIECRRNPGRIYGLDARQHALIIGAAGRAVKGEVQRFFEVELRRRDIRTNHRSP